MDLVLGPILLEIARSSTDLIDQMAQITQSEVDRLPEDQIFAHYAGFTDTFSGRITGIALP